MQINIEKQLFLLRNYYRSDRMVQIGSDYLRLLLRFVSSLIAQ